MYSSYQNVKKYSPQHTSQKHCNLSGRLYVCMYSGIRWTFFPLCPLKSKKKEKQYFIVKIMYSNPRGPWKPYLHSRILGPQWLKWRCLNILLCRTRHNFGPFQMLVPDARQHVAHVTVLVINHPCNLHIQWGILNMMRFVYYGNEDSNTEIKLKNKFLQEESRGVINQKSKNEKWKRPF